MTEADRLYREHAASLVRYLERQLGDRDLAEDVAQETFLRALRHEPKMNPRSWLFTTATNLLRDVARRDSRQRARLEQLHTRQQLEHEEFPDASLRDDSPIHQALYALSERDRTALLLCEEGLSYNEIAVMLGLSMQSVGTTLTRARKRMIQHYESLVGTAIGKGAAMPGNVLEQHVTEETVHAWLDNELSRHDASVVSDHVERCGECADVLQECREVCTTVSHLLGSFDAELRNVPRIVRPSRAWQAVRARVSSVPMISHIVAVSQPVQFWPTARRIMPQAALTMLFAAAASTVMVLGYHEVAGSFTTVAKKRLSGSVAIAGTVNISGTVKETSGIPLKGTIVSVKGSALKTSTNARGQFELRGVPRSTKFLNVRGPLGFERFNQPINFVDAVDPVVNIVMTPVVLTFAPIVVTAAITASGVNAIACLTNVEPAMAASARWFTALRGNIGTTKQFSMQVVDWPNNGMSAPAIFKQQKANTVTGQARDHDAEIRFTLTRDGSQWRGSANETRNGKSHSRQIALRASSCPF